MRRRSTVLKSMDKRFKSEFSIPLQSTKYITKTIRFSKEIIAIMIATIKAGHSSMGGTVLAVPLLSLGPSKNLEKTEILKSVTN